MAKKTRTKANLFDRLLSLDMFGSSINFTINGKQTYDTWCGAIFTVIIMAIVVCYSQFRIREFFNQPLVISESVERGFYNEDLLKVSQKDGDFNWAVAVSTHTNFNNQTAENFQHYGSFKLRYTITGGIEDGLIFDMTLSPCNDYSEFYTHYDSK